MIRSVRLALRPDEMLRSAAACTPPRPALDAKAHTGRGETLSGSDVAGRRTCVCQQLARRLAPNCCVRVQTPHSLFVFTLSGR